MALLTKENGVFLWNGGKDTRAVPKSAGFAWTIIVPGKWATTDPYKAARLISHADPELIEELAPIKALVDAGLFLGFEDGRFVWHGPFETKDRVKAAGLTWDGSNWVTEDKAIASVLKKHATPEAVAAMADALETREASSAMDYSGAEIPVPDRIHPIFNEPLAFRPYQKAGISFMASREGSICGDEMGTGKTIMSVGVGNLVGAKSLLVICPASMKRVWASEIELWSTVDHEIYIVSGKKDAPPETATAVIVNYDLTHAGGPAFEAIMSRDWDLLVVDEAHYCKTPTTKRTKAIFGAKGKKSSAPGFVDRAKLRIALTGTPIPNRIKELYPILDAMQPGAWGSFFSFANRYCGAHHNGYGWDFNGSSNVDELRERMRASVMIRRLKKDVLKELPPKIRQVVVLNTNGAESLVRAEEKAWEESEIALNEARAEADLAHAEYGAESDEYTRAVLKLRDLSTAAFQTMSKVRRDLAIAKVPEVTKHILDALESVDKIVVFAHHKAVVSALMKTLAAKKIKAVRVTGDDNMAARAEAVESFQGDPETRVFVGNIVAAGVGLTLTAASHVIFAELDWVPGNVTQAEDRCHRIGSEIHDSINVQHLVFDGSLDARMAHTLVAKQEVADRALDSGEEVDLGDMKTVAVPAAGKRARPKKYPVATPEEMAAANEAVRYMTALDDDRARFENGIGWSGVDSRIGHDLAERGIHTDGQVWLAKKILRKYRKTQLPTELSEVLWKEDK